LYWIIRKALKHNKEGGLDKWSETMVRRLVNQGFDQDAARRRIDQLIERYEDGWSFQRKPHLIRDRED
jgi:hypothetical protein